MNEFELDWISFNQSFVQMAESKMAELRWLPSSSYVSRNEFESDWISLIQSQSGVRVFLSESERR